MNEFINVFVEITQTIIECCTDAFFKAGNFLKSNLKNIALILNAILPYLMYIIGQQVYSERGKIAAGSEILLPICFCIIIYCLKSLANKFGKGTTIPLPRKRFTEVDEEDGEVSVENNRVHELLLYLADLEDWLERKGLL